mmetsp:Transcript_62529/g.165969  ORF Transcript_62529/g.165969 Transcript_62529/m.165969 type:complete len:239 (-) Transcript_62529:320-1036(-)
MHELDGARPARLVREDLHVLLVQEARDLVRKGPLHERAHRVCERVHGLGLLPVLEDLTVQRGDRARVDVEHDCLRDEEGGHAALEAVLRLELVEQRHLLAVVEVETHARRQPHRRVHLVAVALVHDTLRLDRFGQVDLEDAQTLALVADRACVEARAEDDHLALLAVSARRRRQECVRALIEERRARRDPLKEVGGEVEEASGHDAAGRLREQLQRDRVVELALLREHRPRPQHLQVF